MLDLIRSLHRDFGKSVILATHLLEDVDRVCDHLVLLDSGAVVAHGRIDELREHWKDRFRLRLDGDPTSFIDALGGAGGEVISREASPGSHVELVVRLPEGRRCRDVIELVASLGDRAAVLRSIGPDRERLGDLFRRIVVDRRAPLAGDSTGPSGDDGGRSRVATA